MANTLRELIKCASPLSGDNTVREHLLATDCANLGGGGSGVQIPISIEPADIQIEISEPETMKISLDTQEVKVVISDLEIGVDVTPEEIKTTIKDY